MAVIKRKTKYLLFLLLFSFSLFLFFQQTKIQSQEEKCQLVFPLGNLYERVMEIHKEMIKETTIMKEELEKMFPRAGGEEEKMDNPPVRAVAEYSQWCLFEVANYCPINCSSAPCPDKYLKQIDLALEKMKPHLKVIDEKKEILSRMVEELKKLKEEFLGSQEKLRSFDPKTQILLDCPQAKDLGYLKKGSPYLDEKGNCPSENNYFICQLE